MNFFFLVLSCGNFLAPEMFDADTMDGKTVKYHRN